IKFVFIRKLIKNEGYSLIETLTSFVIFGIFVTLVVTLLVKMLFSTSAKQIKEAQYLGQQEIKYCIANYAASDSSWLSPDSSLIVQRKVAKLENYQHHINVSVLKKVSSDTLVSYNTIYNYFE
ncbi:MAG: hypothetical protein ACEPO8_15245, partial [Rhodothermaceae bacterium]